MKIDKTETYETTKMSGMLAPEDVESLKVYRRKKVVDNAKVTLRTRYGPLEVDVKLADFWGLV